MLTTGIELVQKVKFCEAITVPPLLFLWRVKYLLYFTYKLQELKFFFKVFYEICGVYGNSGLRFVLTHSSEWFSKLYLQIIRQILRQFFFYFSHNGYSHSPLLYIASIIHHSAPGDCSVERHFCILVLLSCRFVSAKPWCLYKHKFWAPLNKVLVRFTHCLPKLILISSSHLCHLVPSVLRFRFLNGLILCNSRPYWIRLSCLLKRTYNV